MSEKKLPTELEDSLRSQMSADSQPKEPSSELVTKEQITDTPFELVGNEERGYFIAIGKYKVSQNYSDKETAIDDAKYPAWDILLNVMSLMASFTFEEERKKLAESN